MTCRYLKSAGTITARLPGVFQRGLESKREQLVYWRTGEENGERACNILLISNTDEADLQ